MGYGCDWSIELREARGEEKAHDLSDQASSGISGTTSCMDQRKQTPKADQGCSTRHPCNVSEWLKLVRKVAGWVWRVLAKPCRGLHPMGQLPRLGMTEALKIG